LRRAHQLERDAEEWWARGACHRARVRATRWLCPPCKYALPFPDFVSPSVKTPRSERAISICDRRNSRFVKQHASATRFAQPFVDRLDVEDRLSKSAYWHLQKPKNHIQERVWKDDETIEPGDPVLFPVVRMYV
jgi:hypothetical protein